VDDAGSWVSNVPDVPWHVWKVVNLV